MDTTLSKDDTSDPTNPIPPSKPPLLQPWLGLRARLFLAPISIPLISLLFVAFRLIMSSHDVNDSVSSAKTSLLSSCHAVEATASLAASLPHFLAATTNDQLAQSVTATVRGAARVFDLSITAIEKILSYIVDSYKSLFVCFMELLVRGSLAVLIEAVQLISQAITAAAQGIRAAIQSSIAGVNDVLSVAVSGINDVVGVFGQHITPPRIAVPSLTALENISLPHEIQDGLLKLNATLPTLDQLKARMDALIETPFEQMRGEVNATLSSFHFSHTVFPLPEMQNVTFCERIDTRPIDELGEELRRVARWGLVVLALVAVVVVLVGVAWEWWGWQREIKGVERTRDVWLAQHYDPRSTGDVADEKEASGDALKTSDLMRLLAISRHPLISSFALSFCQRVGIRTRRAQDRLTWLLSFLTHPASLACIFTGLLGLISVYLQTILVHRLADHYSSSVNTSLTHLTTDVLDMVNDHTRNASLTFSSSANSVISQVETELNGHVFNWVDTTTSTMNTTLNDFLDGITDALTGTFGGTPFNAPLQTFVQCILGRKVEGIEGALTWIRDNAHVNFTMVPVDVLVLKGEQQEEMLRPVREALVGSGGEDGGGVVGNVIGRYLRHLREERVMFEVLVGVYGVILLIGLMVVAYATVTDGWTRRDSEWAGKDGNEVTDEKLGADLKAAPSVGWWRGLRVYSTSSSSGKAIDPPVQPSDMPLVARRMSIAHSSRSGRTHITKDSISYPFQVNHSLTTANTEARPQQPTPLRQTSAARDTILSLQQPTPQPPVSSSNDPPRSSWHSFLAKHSHDDSSRPSEVKAPKADNAEEAAEDRFERLFGCSPATRR